MPKPLRALPDPRVVNVAADPAHPEVVVVRLELGMARPTTDAEPVLALTVPEVAQRLRCSDAMVWGLIRSGELPSFQIATLRRVSSEDCDAYIRRQPRRTGEGE
jgi:excisionase family DNA binding protein